MDMSMYKDTYVYNDKKQLDTTWISINKLYITYVNYTTTLSSTAVFISNVCIKSLNCGQFKSRHAVSAKYTLDIKHYEK